MKIGIDARIMYPKGEGSGIGRYIIEMVEAMIALPESRTHEFILYPYIHTQKLELPANWMYSEKKNASRGITRSLIYPFIARRDSLDVFYSADYLGPILPMPCKTVITIHDIIPVVYPDVTSFKHRLVGRYLLPHSIKNASVIISVSHATKNDILKYIDVPEDKIKVIYEGKNSSFYPRDQDREIIHKVCITYGIGERPYILFLGTLEPKKNLINIVKAFSQIKDAAGKNYVLVLGGNIGWDSSVLEFLIRDCHLEDEVIFTGFVEEEDLPYLLSGARAFCFPSLYEGFGLPVLEAMACGCPVITSNVSSLPEVTGNAALLVDPYDVQQIADAMTKVLTDDKLCEDLKQRGLKQAKKFSWETAARQLLDIFNTMTT